MVRIRYYFPLFCVAQLMMLRGKSRVQHLQCCGINKGLSFKGSWGEPFTGIRTIPFSLCLSLRPVWPSFSSGDLRLWCWGGRGGESGSPGKKGVVWERCFEFVSFPIALLWFDWKGNQVGNQFNFDVLVIAECPSLHPPPAAVFNNVHLCLQADLQSFAAFQGLCGSAPSAQSCEMLSVPCRCDMGVSHNLCCQCQVLEQQVNVRTSAPLQAEPVSRGCCGIWHRVAPILHQGQDGQNSCNPDVCGWGQVLLVPRLLHGRYCAFSLIWGMNCSLFLLVISELKPWAMTDISYHMGQ